MGGGVDRQAQVRGLPPRRLGDFGVRFRAPRPLTASRVWISGRFSVVRLLTCVKSAVVLLQEEAGQRQRQIPGDLGGGLGPPDLGVLGGARDVSRQVVRLSDNTSTVAPCSFGTCRRSTPCHEVLADIPLDALVRSAVVDRIQTGWNIGLLVVKHLVDIGCDRAGWQDGLVHHRQATRRGQAWAGRGLDVTCGFARLGGPVGREFDFQIPRFSGTLRTYSRGRD